MLDRTLRAALLLLLATAPRAAADPAPTPTPARVSVAGRPDPTFGVAGRVTETNDDVGFTAFALQPDGKIVVAGNRPGDASVVVVRYAADGTLDPTFGTGGKVVSDLPAVGYAEAVAVTNDGDVVVAGSTYAESDDPHGSDLLVLRYTADGLPAADFSGGLAVVDVGVNGIGRALLVQGDRRVIVAGDSNRSDIAAPFGVAVLVGLLPDGRLDPTFGEGGVARTEATPLDGYVAGGVLQERDGSLVSAVTSYSDIVGRRFVHLTRFDHDGHPVEPFDVASGYARDLVLDASGRIVASGGVFDDMFVPHGVVMRWRPDGRRDGERGTLPLPEIADSLPAVAIDRDGGLVVAGDVLSRHLPDGTLDRDFGVAGVASGSVPDAFFGVGVQPDDAIVAVGSRFEALGFTNVVARYEGRTRLCGDADASGAFTVSDGVATLRAAAGLASACSERICDTDGSGDVTVSDAVNVLRAAAGLSATLGCGIP